jgi:outer membrane protein, multidrug efflux system
MTRGVVLLLVTALSAAACAARGPYTPPEVAPAALINTTPALVVEQPFDPRWWAQFEDPILDALVVRGLDANHDVRIALARVDQAQSVFAEVRRDRFPTVTAGASADRRDQAIPGFADEPRGLNTFRAGFDSYWELDLFGRVRSQIRAADATAQSFEATADDVRVRVVAEIARTYFEIRGRQQQLAVAERSLANQRETLRLAEVRRDNGIGEEQDVASAAARVAAIQASIPPIRNDLAEREHRVAVLIGVRPGQLGVDLSPRAYPPLAKALAVGEPATLLRRRPDIRAAERQLAAAAAREGVVAADLYPRITITGFLGLLAGRGNFFDVSDTRAYAITPALSWAAFDIGSVRDRLRGVEAATRESATVFEQAVLRALEETENALVAYRETQQRLIQLTTQARESARAADIARVRYREGAVDFLALLDAERTQLQAEDGVAQAESTVFTSVIALYKALGGLPANATPAPRAVTVKQ